MPTESDLIRSHLRLVAAQRNLFQNLVSYHELTKVVSDFKREYDVLKERVEKETGKNYDEETQELTERQ